MQPLEVQPEMRTLDSRVTRLAASWNFLLFQLDKQSTAGEAQIHISYRIKNLQSSHQSAQEHCRRRNSTRNW